MASKTPDWAMQEAIFARLKEELTDNVEVVDNMEISAYKNSLPFVLIGDDQLVDVGIEECGEGFELTSRLRCHAAGPSRKASKFLAQDVRDAMNKLEFTLTDWTVSNAQHVGSISEHFGDGLGHLVVVTWQFEIYAKRN